MNLLNASHVPAGAARVLVVDDDVALAAGLVLAMEGQEYLARAVHRGEDAIRAASTFRPDLIVLDVMMPSVDGWQVLGLLRGNEATRSIPVIMLTAVDSDDAKVRGFSLGADDYVTKPFNLDVLLCRVAAVLRRSDPGTEDGDSLIPVVAGGSKVELLRSKDVYFVEGVRNYTYVHTIDSRFLGRLGLGALEKKGAEGLRRVHRSFIVNIDHVRRCGWVGRSSYRLWMNDTKESEIPVSRALIADVQRDLGLRS